MASRFTDSRKWDDPWFRKLPCKYKAFFIFLLDKCNHAGIWKVDFESAEFHIGEAIVKEEAIGMLNGRVVVLKEKWFVPNFIKFQYQVSGMADLNPENRVHKSVIEILKKEGAYKPLLRGLLGCKDKDYDKDKDIKGVVKGDFETIWAKYPNRVGKKHAQRHFEATVKTEQDKTNINKALDNYLKSERVIKGFVQNGSTWFNQWQDWVDKPITKPNKDSYESYIVRS
jgi:hypothetical protein